MWETPELITKINFEIDVVCDVDNSPIIILFFFWFINNVNL